MGIAPTIAEIYCFGMLWGYIMIELTNPYSSKHRDVSTVFGVVFWGLNTFSEGIWNTREWDMVRKKNDIKNEMITNVVCLCLFLPEMGYAGYTPQLVMAFGN